MEKTPGFFERGEQPCKDFVPDKKIKLITILSQEISLIKNKINNATFWKFFEVAQRLAMFVLLTNKINNATFSRNISYKK